MFNYLFNTHSTYVFFSFRGSYHGGSPQTMGLTSNAAYKYPIANGLGCTNVCTSSFIRSFMRQRPSRSLLQQCCSRAVCEWMWLSGSVQLTRSLLTEQTMCPDVFRGPWGGSHCRDSPVQTIRDCNCAQGTRTVLSCRNTQLCLYCGLNSNEISIKDIYNLQKTWSQSAS